MPKLWYSKVEEFHRAIPQCPGCELSEPPHFLGVLMMTVTRSPLILSSRSFFFAFLSLTRVVRLEWTPSLSAPVVHLYSVRTTLDTFFDFSCSSPPMALFLGQGSSMEQPTASLHSFSTS